MVTFGTFLLIFVLLWCAATALAAALDAPKAFRPLVVPLAIWLTVGYPGLIWTSTGFNDLMFGAGHSPKSIDSIVTGLISVAMGLVTIGNIGDHWSE